MREKFERILHQEVERLEALSQQQPLPKEELQRLESLARIHKSMALAALDEDEPEAELTLEEALAVARDKTPRTAP